MQKGIDVAETWHRLLATSELAEGAMKAFEIDGREIVVCHSREGWHALDNICSHAYARMCEGRLRGIRLICPLHGASFDVRDGSVLGAPASTPLARHTLRIVDDQVEVALAV
ncbi:MAG: Rieske (2Fe-2S) protein [Steroidobacteraceae bacterium]